jgi:hypothetical protein
MKRKVVIEVDASVEMCDVGCPWWRYNSAGSFTCSLFEKTLELKTKEPKTFTRLEECCMAEVLGVE